MRTIKLLASVTLALGLVASVAGAANPASPAAGHYSLGGKNGFTVVKARTSVSGLRFAVNVGSADTSDCSPVPGLPAGKLVLKVSKHLKLVAAHRGGFTTYIVGRSTPKTSSGITPIPVTFSVSSGGTVKGTLSLAFTTPKGGDAQFLIDGGCSLFPGFSKG